jgi:hypothetical protein
VRRATRPTAQINASNSTRRSAPACSTTMNFCWPCRSQRSALWPTQHLHAVGLQRFERQLRDVHVFAQQDARRHFHLGDLRAQALEALRQLAADRAAAEHHHPPGHCVELRKGVPQGVAGDIAHVCRARAAAARKGARRRR